MRTSQANGHIVIFVHAQSTFIEGTYYLGAIASVWKEMGLKVSVQQGPGSVHEADLAIVHVDLTKVPDDHLSFVRQYPQVLNIAVTDISKRKISAGLVRRGDGYRGPVIVKTDSNFGGGREADLARRNSQLGRIMVALRRRLPWSLRSELSVTAYPIFDSTDRVPLGVWINPALVVERFQPEMREGHYCLRTWLFFGDKETNWISYSKDPVIKSDHVIKREIVDEVPEELRKIRRDLGFDFGKFDYAMVDGRVVLYDANRTPSLGNFPAEQYMPRARILAEGIHAYL